MFQMMYISNMKTIDLKAWPKAYYSSGYTILEENISFELLTTQ